ncbi:hypothetical protein BaRGS_00003612 [Batillaria attramentaria]|uniref:Uncharacterized protein n=1 Tax=Batillaria attramentaria TaxID=370345 RepID=A0ABD0M073_9CAEN
MSVQVSLAWHSEANRQVYTQFQLERSGLGTEVNSQNSVVKLMLEFYAGCASLSFHMKNSFPTGNPSQDAVRPVELAGSTAGIWDSRPNLSAYKLTLTTLPVLTGSAQE